MGTSYLSSTLAEGSWWIETVDYWLCTRQWVRVTTLQVEKSDRAQRTWVNHSNLHSFQGTAMNEFCVVLFLRKSMCIIFRNTTNKDKHTQGTHVRVSGDSMMILAKQGPSDLLSSAAESPGSGTRQAGISLWLVIFHCITLSKLIPRASVSPSPN